jgi:hypothetical protein
MAEGFSRSSRSHPKGLGPKILHIWNTAGVASVIAKFTDRDFGTMSTVITRKAADRVGLTNYGRAYDDGAAVFFARAIWMAGGADLVHVHSLDRIVPWVKRFHDKPVVMHYHGTDIERRWEQKEGRWKKADFVAVSTPNLLEGGPESAIYMPNPVDTDIFRPSGAEREKGSALSFRYGMDAEAQQAAKRFGLSLTLLDRGSVPHDKMPEVLSKYEYYIDMRKPPRHIVARSLGMAALEALACSRKVVNWSGEVVEGLPREHEPSNVAAEWHRVYERLLNS